MLLGYSFQKDDATWKDIIFRYYYHKCLIRALYLISEIKKNGITGKVSFHETEEEVIAQKCCDWLDIRSGNPKQWRFPVKVQGIQRQRP